MVHVYAKQWRKYWWKFINLIIINISKIEYDDEIINTIPSITFNVLVITN